MVIKRQLYLPSLEIHNALRLTKVQSKAVYYHHIYSICTVKV